MQVNPFPSLQKKMRDYTEERQNSINSFLPTQKHPNRSNPSSLPRVVPKRKRTVKDIPKKVKRNYTPRNWVTFTTQPKAAEKSVQTQQTEAPFTVTKLVTATPTNPNTIAAMIPALPSPPIPVISQKRRYLPIVQHAQIVDRPCPTLFLQLFLHPTLIGQTQMKKKKIGMVKDKNERNKEKRNGKKMNKKC